MRPIIVAMNNPLSDDPAHALAPFPAGSAGHRLYRLLADRRPNGLLRRGYMQAFDRRNLVAGKVWSMAGARDGARALLDELAGTRATVLVLGDGPRLALGLPRIAIYPCQVGTVTFRQLPHPSGRCLWYNESAHRVLAGMLLEELFDMEN